MTIASRTLVEKFTKGATEGKAARIFIEDNCMYSYGRHFELMRRMDWGFLLNADKYSSSTSRHQGYCMKHATIQIPYSALISANIFPRSIDLIDHESQRWDKTGNWYTWTDKGRKVISNSEYLALDAEDAQGYEEEEERRPEAAVISYNEKFYLSSMDGNQFFLCKLPYEVTTVAEAFESLKPPEIIGLTNDEFRRQGEWFFVPTSEIPINILKDGVSLSAKKLSKLFYQSLLPNFVLPNRDTTGNPHTATRGIQLNNDTYVSGHVRHPEHKMLNLSYAKDPQFFKVYENTALGSWGAIGNVD